MEFAFLGIAIVAIFIAVIVNDIVYNKKWSNERKRVEDYVRKILSIYREEKYLSDSECDFSHYSDRFIPSLFDSRKFFIRILGHEIYSGQGIREAIEKKNDAVYSKKFSKETQERLKCLWLQMADSLDKKLKYFAEANSLGSAGSSALSGSAAPKAKSAKKEVIKGAVVGGIIAGEAGAVVGAIAAKAEQDAKKSK